MVVVVVVVFLCGGCDCMWWWLYVVVEAVHGGDGHLCVAVHGGIYIYIYIYIYKAARPACGHAPTIQKLTKRD